MKLVSKKEIKNNSGATNYLVQKITNQLNAEATGKYGTKLYKADQIKKVAENEITKSKIYLKTMDCLKKIITWLSKENQEMKLIAYEGGKSRKYEGLTTKQKNLAIALGNLVKNFQELNNFLDQEDDELETIL
jgi:hypothetical protein